MLLSPFRTLGMLRVATLVALAAAVGCAKGGDPGGTTPTPTTPANIAGTWSGAASDSSGTGTMSWTVTQNGSTISGPLAIIATDVNVSGVGTLSGTVTGNTISFTLTIPPGGFGAPFASCSSTSSGTATVSGATISGSYTGTVSGASSCSGAITAGQLNLNKQ
jgi:hypothetical protein